MLTNRKQNDLFVSPTVSFRPSTAAEYLFINVWWTEKLTNEYLISRVSLFL